MHRKREEKGKVEKPPAEGRAETCSLRPSMKKGGLYEAVARAR